MEMSAIRKQKGLDKMGICVITGASSGIGREFFRQLTESMEHFDAYWVIARREAPLRDLQTLTSVPVRILPLDLSLQRDCEAYGAALKEAGQDVQLLIHCAGYGKFESTENIGLETQLNMVDLNVKATVNVDLLTLPYMHAGARMINIASVAALQPVPWVNTYAATKSFVLSFSRGLHRELRGRGITVTAVCPFWTKTAFFDRAVKTEQTPVVKKYMAMYDPVDIVRRALRDSQRGRDVSFFGFVARGQALLVKLLPVPLILNIWQRQQKLY